MGSPTLLDRGGGVGHPVAGAALSGGELAVPAPLQLPGDVSNVYSTVYVRPRLSIGDRPCKAYTGCTKSSANFLTFLNGFSSQNRYSRSVNYKI